MRRGEVWWADLPPPAGRRPVVLLSRNEAYAVRQLVIVAPITTRVRRIPTEVPLGPEEGLPKACVVNLDTLTTIPKHTLTQPIGPLPPGKLAAVERALRFALDLAGAQPQKGGLAPRRRVIALARPRKRPRWAAPHRSPPARRSPPRGTHPACV